MNTVRIVMLPVLRKVLRSNNNNNFEGSVKHSILISQILNVSQKISRYYSSELPKKPDGRLDKDLLGTQRLQDFLQDPANQKHYQMILLEIELMRQNGYNIPEVIKDRHMYELVMFNSRTKRRRFLEFLFGIEKKKEHRKSKADEGSKHPSEEINELSYLRYKLGQNSPFLRFRDQSMNKYNNWSLLRAMMFGQKVIVDCGFEDKMSAMEIKNTAKQLMLTFSVNRSHPNPLDLIYCNLKQSGPLYEEFYSFVPTLNNPDFPLNTTDKSYLDVFDRNKLVYLSPDSSVTLEKYDYDAIYIIGAIVDKGASEAHSMLKAKRQGIRHVKLPIDQYVRFGSGSRKTLTLNQMLLILADLQCTQDWSYALRHIPQRKLYHNRLQEMEKKVNDFLSEESFASTNIIKPNTNKRFDIKSRNKFNYLLGRKNVIGKKK